MARKREKGPEKRKTERNIPENRKKWTGKPEETDRKTGQKLTEKNVHKKHYIYRKETEESEKLLDLVWILPSYF
jgi:hypothetical protein